MHLLKELFTTDSLCQSSWKESLSSVQRHASSVQFHYSSSGDAREMKLTGAKQNLGGIWGICGHAPQRFIDTVGLLII